VRSGPSLPAKAAIGNRFLARALAGGDSCGSQMYPDLFSSALHRERLGVVVLPDAKEQTCRTGVLALADCR
jgi:hypothetical protein